MKADININTSYNHTINLVQPLSLVQHTCWPHTTYKVEQNITWYNPPFSKGVKTNLGKVFLALVRKQFMAGSLLYAVYITNTLKASYSSAQELWLGRPLSRHTTGGSSARVMPYRRYAYSHATEDWRTAAKCRENVRYEVYTKPQWEIRANPPHISGAIVVLKNVLVDMKLVLNTRRTINTQMHYQHMYGKIT